MTKNRAPSAAAIDASVAPAPTLSELILVFHQCVEDDVLAAPFNARRSCTAFLEAIPIVFFGEKSFEAHATASKVLRLIPDVMRELHDVRAARARGELPPAKTTDVAAARGAILWSQAWNNRRR